MNMSRYLRFAVSTAAGMAYMVAKPTFELLKRAAPTPARLAPSLHICVSVLWTSAGAFLLLVLGRLGPLTVSCPPSTRG